MGPPVSRAFAIAELLVLLNQETFLLSYSCVCVSTVVEYLHCAEEYQDLESKHQTGKQEVAVHHAHHAAATLVQPPASTVLCRP
jgi:hypothetical protein